MKTLIVMLAAGLSSALLVGCTDETTSSAGAGEAANTYCPIMGSKIDGETSTEWNGKKIGFCCPPCVDEWAEMTDEERQAALDKAAEDAGVGHEHGDQDHGDHGHAEHGDHDHGEQEHAGGDHDEHGDDEKQDASPEAAAPEAAAKPE